MRKDRSYTQGINFDRYYYQIPINAVLLVLSVLFTLAVQRHDQAIGGGISRPLLFFLINIEIFIAILLIVSIIRQSVILFLERRKGRPGSIFKKNLLFSFIFLSILPGAFVFFGASKLVVKHLELWFGTRVEVGLSSGLALYAATSQEMREQLAHQGAAWLDTGSERWAVSGSYPFCSKVWHISEQGVSLGREPSRWRSFREFNDRGIKELKKSFIALLDTVTTTPKIIDFFGSTYWVARQEDRYLALVYRPPAPIRRELIRIQNAQSDYRALREVKSLLKFNFYLQAILLLILVLVLAIWCAFYLARGISEPIQLLLEATHDIKEGKLGAQIAPIGARDLQHLTESFNEMSRALSQAQASLNNKNQELIALFEHLSVSVFLISYSGRVITCNQSAQSLMSKLTGKTLSVGRRFHSLPKACKDVIQGMLWELEFGKERSRREVNLQELGQQLMLVLHLQRLGRGATSPYLLVVEDLSSVMKENTFKTWQEAVKQIAHEIKNPLTPIQLATQRLQRRFNASLPDNEKKLLQEGCTLILDQVATIKRLVADFSSFAVAPRLELQPMSVGRLIDDVIALFRLSYPEIRFHVDTVNQEGTVLVDEDKIKRVFTNLITNSIEAFAGAQTEKPLITIKITEDLHKIYITLADNGPGIADDLRANMFLPYVSTSNKNMGLGLAIVHTIVTQHQGVIAVVPSSCGATFVIELPKSL